MALVLIIAILSSYLIGSIPTGYWLVKGMKGIDIRTVGSGNIGATNVKRVLGMKWFFIVLILDAAKGFLPVFVLSTVYGEQHPYIGVIAAVAAVLGHTFTIFLKFKGGKGVATGLGVFLALTPLSVLTCLVLFSILLKIFKYISLGSITATFFLPFFVCIYGEGGYLNSALYLSVVLALFVILKHIDNIKRLISGTENKFTSSKKGEAK